MTRIAILAASLALVACSSTARLYDGPERPDSEIAVAEVDQTPAWLAALFGGMRGSILSVDGEFLEADRVELSPGPHELCAELLWTPSGVSSFYGGRVRFEAEAGVEYWVRAAYDDDLGYGVEIVDMTSGETLARSHKPLAEHDPLPLGLDAEGWVRINGGETCTRRMVSWAPSGETAEDWTELVELHETTHAAGVSPDVSVAFDEHEQALRQALAKDVRCEVLSQDESTVTFRYGGTTWDASERHDGVGLLAARGARLLQLTRESRSRELSAEERESWLARFTAALTLER